MPPTEPSTIRERFHAAIDENQRATRTREYTDINVSWDGIPVEFGVARHETQLLVPEAFRQAVERALREEVDPTWVQDIRLTREGHTVNVTVDVQLPPRVLDQEFTIRLDEDNPGSETMYRLDPPKSFDEAIDRAMAHSEPTIGRSAWERLIGEDEYA
jgi:hypothetical protein